jgi:MHS family shikimate/dehydroshikimate transporter-like MFS transporter
MADAVQGSLTGLVNNQAGLAPPARKVVLASAFGTIIEWYDFFIYGTAAALVFGKTFFPADDPVVSTLAAFSVFAVGYLARPLGGIVFGHFGDRIGRRSMLVISIMLMGGGTFLVGFLPSYQQIGILAPIFLIVLRIIQAIGLGGEWGGAVLMVAETAPPNRRGLFGSIVQMGNPLGRLIATGVFALATRLPESEFLSWGWRLPFLASVLLIMVGVFIRLNLDETPAFERMRATKKTARIPLVDVLTTYRRETLIAIGIKVTEVAWVNILSVFAVAYLTGQLGMSQAFILDAVTLATLCELFNIGSPGDCDWNKHLPRHRVRPPRQLHARAVRNEGAIFRNIARLSDWRRAWRRPDPACRRGRSGLERRYNVADFSFSGPARINHHVCGDQQPGKFG